MADQPRTELSRDLGLFTITMVGVGAMIGAGIFVLTGIAAGTAGPALMLAFAANGLVTFLTALAYAELGSAIPEAGGGYLWVKEGLPGPNAFLAGWMSWFAHAVAGSLYALGFSSYLRLVLQEFHVTLFNLPLVYLDKPLAVVIALIFIAINFKGVSETGTAGNIVTVAKIIIIGLFIASGLYAIYQHPVYLEKFTPLAPKGFGGVLAAMGLTYIAFEGYEIIVQAGEEVKNPKKNIPRAVLLSLAIVIPIYILVAVAAVGAVDTGSAMPSWQWLGNHKELGLAEAARQFMPLGTALLLIGGILSTMSALNATTFSSTRVSFAMGRDRNLPDFFAKINPETKTPYLALIASGTLIILMAVAVPIEDVAAAADVMFLLLFLQVNIAIITIRRKYGDKLDYGFLIPFFPFTPILAIVLMIVIAVFMFEFSPLAWYFVIGWIGIGFVLYYTYARKRERAKKATPIVLQQMISANEEEGLYKVLVPVSNPNTVNTLIDFAGMVAQSKDGEVVLLNVITIPSQSPLEVGQRYIKKAQEEILDKAVERLASRDIPVRAVVRIARKPAQGIIDQVEEHNVDMVVMGWRGSPSHPKTVIGTNIDQVMKDADCDVVVLRGDDFTDIKNMFIPVAHPAQAGLMLRIGEMFAENQSTELDLYHFVSPEIGQNEDARQRRVEGIYKGLEDANNDTPEKEPKGRRNIHVESESDIVKTIVDYSSKYDATILGAAREGWFRKLVVGTKPEQIARLAKGKLLIVKRRRMTIQSGLMDIVEFFRGHEADFNQN